MNSNEQYIQQVAKAAESTGSVVDVVKNIANLKLPHDANPLLVLIHGDSLQLEFEEEIRRNGQDEVQGDLSEKEAYEKLASHSLEKIKRYLNDWQRQNIYYYDFRLLASYGMYVEADGETHYIEIIKNCDAATAVDAVTAAKDWDKTLFKKIRIHSGQERDYLHISTKPIYDVFDAQHARIASGILQGEGDFGVSTWSNQR